MEKKIKVMLTEFEPIAHNLLKVRFSEEWFFKSEEIKNKNGSITMKITENLGGGLYFASLMTMERDVKLEEYFVGSAHVDCFQKLFKDFPYVEENLEE